ncbi:MAG: cupin domain-containing protein [Deltaproteobacteria bacterium]|nr:cupin domain-containing protein [Deltaproteobacteria bacterium]
MTLEVRSWDGNGAPDEETLAHRLAADGFSSFCWSDLPNTHYDEHEHDRDESIWLLAGAIRFGAAGRELALAPGDRLMLPAGTRHTADAGPDGATYLIGQRS